MSELPLEGSPQAGTATLDAPAPAPAPEAPKPAITQEFIRNAYKRRDFDAIKKVANDLEGKSKPGAEPAKPAQPGAEPAPAPAAGGAKTPFNVRYSGREVVHPDDDHYLGEGTFPGLKRRTIILKEIVKEKEAEVEEAKKYGMQTASEKEQLAKELEAAKKQLADVNAQIKATPQPQSQPAPVQAPAAVQQKVDAALDLVPPKRPTYSSPDRSLWNEQDIALNEKFESETSDYISKLTEAVKTGRNAGITQADIEVLATKIAEQKVQEVSGQLTEKFKKVEAWEQDQQRQTAALEQKRAEDKLFSEITDFQKKHEEFKTPQDVKEIQPSVFKWMQAVAAANGLRLPYGYTQEQYARFWESAFALGRKYVEGDETVKAKSEGIDPPAGAAEYINLATVLNYRNASAPGLTLDEAYAAFSEKMGWNQRAHDEAQKEGLLRGVRSVQRAVSGMQSQYATNIPNRAAGQGQAPTSAQDHRAILAEVQKGGRRAIDAIRRDPEKSKQYDAALAWLNAGAGAPVPA